ncbi:MAG: DsbA family protein [Acidimicrobiales bacterium]|nr:DsbA family protein [Acidimicrobiales bacterium]
MRLDELVQQEGDKITIQWKSFLLRPQSELRDMAEFTEYTKSWERPASLEPLAQFSTPWSGENPPPSHSLPAAVAGKTAATFGELAWRRYHYQMLRAYFTKNLDISDSDVLLDLAHDVDIDKHIFEETLKANREIFESQIFAEHNEALSNGINGVPAAVIGNKYLISGAVGIDHYKKALAHYRDIDSREN